MFKKLNNEELEKVYGGEIFKMIPTGELLQLFIEKNTDSQGHWHPCVAPEIIRLCSPYYIVGSNPYSLFFRNEKKYSFYTLAEAEQFARSKGYNTNVIDVINAIDF